MLVFVLPIFDGVIVNGLASNDLNDESQRSRYPRATTPRNAARSKVISCWHSKPRPLTKIHDMKHMFNVFCHILNKVVAFSHLKWKNEQ